MGEMFTLPLYAQISLFVLSNLLLFFIGPVPSAKRKVMTKKQYTNKRFLSSLILWFTPFFILPCKMCPIALSFFGASFYKLYN